MSYFLDCFTKKYVCFEGRASRVLVLHTLQHARVVCAHIRFCLCGGSGDGLHRGEYLVVSRTSARNLGFCPSFARHESFRRELFLGILADYRGHYPSGLHGHGWNAGPQQVRRISESVIS